MSKCLITMEAFVRFPDFNSPSLDGKVMFRVTLSIREVLASTVDRRVRLRKTLV